MGKTGKKAAITKDIIDTFTGAIGDGLSVTGAAGAFLDCLTRL